MKLRDRVAIVTGASSGVGRGIAIEFAKEGAKVVVADIQEEPKRGKYFELDLRTPTIAAIQNLGAEGLFVQTDVSREAEIRRLVDQTLERFGRLDIVVNNAGINVPGTTQ